MLINTLSKQKKQTKFDLRLLNFITETIGPKFEISKVYGGLVHDVYKIHNKNTYHYLKLRGSYFSMIPNIVINPKDIKYEKKALEIFSKLLPDIFPTIIAFNEELSAIILSDINPSGYTLELLFNQQKVNVLIMEKIGIALGRTHFYLRTITDSIRPDDDKNYYESNFCDRFLKFNYPIANICAKKLVSDLKKIPRQLILSDLSPKNIGISEDNKISFFDLECVHKGNTIFDLGFLLGHITLHSKNNSNVLIKSLLQGYMMSINDSIDSKMLEKIMGITILYRLCNEIIPYPLPISDAEKKALIEKACCLLNIDKK
ncbi:MAG: hypothetical protein WCO12_00170 [bacterium]